MSLPPQYLRFGTGQKDFLQQLLRWLVAEAHMARAEWSHAGGALEVWVVYLEAAAPRPDWPTERRQAERIEDALFGEDGTCHPVRITTDQLADLLAEVEGLMDLTLAIGYAPQPLEPARAFYTFDELGARYDFALEFFGACETLLYIRDPQLFQKATTAFPAKLAQAKAAPARATFGRRASDV